jgi:cell division protein ZapB
MNTDKLKQLCANHLTSLETGLADLLAHCEQLRLENQSLRAREQELLAERDSLIQKNEQARTRIEAMVMRLKGLGDPNEQ